MVIYVARSQIKVSVLVIYYYTLHTPKTTLIVSAFLKARNLGMV